MTVTLSLPFLLGICLSVALFAGVTVLAWTQGLFEDAPYGVGGMFALMLYAILWALPSLAGWAIYATWFSN